MYDAREAPVFRSGQPYPEMRDASSVAADPRDLELRKYALEHVRELARRYDDIVPRAVLLEGFPTPLGRISYGSFYSGIFKPRQFSGPAALSLVTTPPKDRREAPYDDGYDETTKTFRYHYRRPRENSERARLAAAADNRALRAALELGVPLIYFNGIAPSQYTPVAPVFLTRDDPVRELVEFQAALPVADATGSRRTRRSADTPHARRTTGSISIGSARTSCVPTAAGARSAACARRRSCRPRTSSRTATRSARRRW